MGLTIAFDTAGKILGVGQVAGALPYVGIIPTDFMDTFGLGKYTMVEGVITPTPGWVLPPTHTAPPGL